MGKKGSEGGDSCMVFIYLNFIGAMKYYNFFYILILDRNSVPFHNVDIGKFAL